MNSLKLKVSLLAVFCFGILTTNSFAQEQKGQVAINQDANITKLLALKKELNRDETSPDRFKIQIYNGSRSGAEAAQKDYNSSYSEWRSSLEFELPRNYKIWIGSFKTKIEAERALRKIKRKFPNSIIFKPRKKR